MRVTPPARIAALALLAASSLVLVAGPADAVVDPPTRVGNDGVKTLTVRGAAPYYDTDNEVLKVHANPANGSADVTGTTTSTGTCTGATIPLVSNSSCEGPVTASVDTTNLPSGTYDVIESRTDVTTFPSATTTSATVGQITVFAQPKFAASGPVAPASRGQGSTTSITLKGTGFKAGMTASFGAGTVASNLVVGTPASGQLTVDVAVDAAAVPGKRDVVLTSPDDGLTPGTKASATLTDGFTVTIAPTVTAITPTSGVVGSTQAATVTGTDFVSGPDFVLIIPGVTAANVTVVNPTTVTANLTPNVGALAGPRSVSVTNPDGGAGSLPGAFTIIAPPNAPTGLSALIGEGSVFLSWAAPLNTGTGPVTGYRVTSSAGGPAPFEVTGRSALIPNLTNGTEYTFTVAAKNAEAGYGVESAPRKATPKYAMTLVNHAAVGSLVSGQSTTFSGRLTRTTGNVAVPGAPLAIRYAPQVGAAFTHNVVTAADGTWHDTAVVFTYTTVVTASYPGNATLQPKSTSATEPVATRVRVTSPSPGATTRVGTLLTVTGPTSPNKAGHTVYLYRVLAGGHLQALTKSIVSSKGIYTLRVNLGRGAYTLRVGVVAAGGNTAGYSSPFIARRV